MPKRQPDWYVESDGHGPYICEQRHGRIATIELESFRANGGSEDWKRATLMAAAPKLLQACLRVLHEVADDLADKDDEFLVSLPFTMAEIRQIAAAVKAASVTQ